MAALIAALQTMQYDMQLSPGASGFPSFPQVTKEEREKGNAGDPIGDDDTIAQTRATTKERTDAAAAKVNAEAAAAQASVAMKQVQKQARPEVPLESFAKKSATQAPAK
jgi:hypothetical protein